MITQKEKIEKYENLLHLLQLNCEVTLNHDNARQLLGNICRWSYAHRMGNGENSEKEQQALIDYAFHKLTEIKQNV